jgi:hypothetical protein
LAVSVVFLALAWEGVMCLAMALPVYAVTTAFGTALGCFLAEKNASRLSVSALALLPAGFWVEAQTARDGWHDEVTTETVINAPPSAIWPLLSNLSAMVEPSEFLFRNGIAHPISIQTKGGGVGASRTCVLSTGNMPEVITVWEPNRRLGFRVLSTPASMKELNPFGEVKAEHLKGYYECEYGEFNLTPLPGGRTKITGLSRYSCRFGPGLYWRMWTRKIVHDVHQRVFNEIRNNPR